MPAFGDMKTNEGQDKIRNLVAEKQAIEAVLILEMSLAQAESVLEISEHLFNPEALLVPGNGLLGVAFLIRF
ncbi:MAG TPA: hypothetical protein VLY63_16350 [Anaerolineae bacterium]|nr:hypothetical protein [Anaerolineae bacterium]